MMRLVFLLCISVQVACAVLPTQRLLFSLVDNDPQIPMNPMVPEEATTTTIIAPVEQETTTTVMPTPSTIIAVDPPRGPEFFDTIITNQSEQEDCLPPKVVSPVYACNNQLNSSFTCSNAEFVRSTAHFVKCNTHDDCLAYQQPNNWCTLPWEYEYTKFGCYCDKKIGSCVIERAHRFTMSRQWAYCQNRSEYSCNKKTVCL